jgi:hypothetical protein
VISHSIRSASAWLLVLLVALPFTAPFSSCDISMWLGATPHHRARTWSSTDAATASIEAAMTESESGAVLDEEFKDAALTPVRIGIAIETWSGAPDRVVVHPSVSRSLLVALRL